MTSKGAPASAWRYAALAALAAVAVPHHLLVTRGSLRDWLSPQHVASAPFSVEPRTDLVAAPSEEARRAGVAAGDRLLAVEGRPYVGTSSLARAVAERRPGDALRLTLATAQGPRVAVVPLGRLPSAQTASLLLTLLLGVAMPMLCLGLGLAVALLRPWDKQAWLLLFMLLGFANFFSGVRDQAAWPGLVRVPTLAYHWFFASAWAPAVLLFGIQFPERPALDRRLPWLVWLLAGPLLLLSVVGALSGIADSESLVLAGALNRLSGPLRASSNLLFMAAVSAGFVALGLKTRRATNPDSRRRLALITWGGQVGLAPLGLIALVAALLRRAPFEGVPAWASAGALLLVPVFPLTLAYAVVVHRALDLRNTIRQGLQYALARGGIRVLQVAASAAALVSAAALAAAPQVNRPQRITVIAVSVGVVFVSRLIAEKLLAFTDRRFFREAYDAERVLTELSEQVRAIPDAEPLLQTVTARLADTLHVPRVAVLLLHGDDLETAVALGTGAAAVRLPAAGRVAARLERDRAPLFVYPDDPGSWLWRDEVPQAERDALSALAAQLLLPLATKQGLQGLLALGPKLSEEAYSASDTRLLSSVAGQTALALENARLTRAVAEEAAARARMEREIEIAREVQESLYPQERPAISRLDFAGRCRPARGVGGDYFDFRCLAPETLSVAIGDVSGKGIPAALLMASLQASIRGQELAGTDDLGLLMANVNRLVYESSPSNRYATLFYGRYAADTRRLRFVNAGHNPPMLFRAAGALERLEAGGPVCGLLPGAPYAFGEVTLCAGDLLVLYTDGISEAMSAAEEEWGETRLADAVRALGAAPAPAVLDGLFAAADAFTRGAAQYDDMTLVVLRVGD